MVTIVVVTHGEFGAYLLEAAEMILGEQKEGVHVVGISPRTSAEKAHEMVKSAVSGQPVADGVIFLTDILGGTPTMIAMPAAKNIEKSAVYSGVNLSMLVCALNYRARMNFEQLTEKVLNEGKKSVCDVKALFAASEKKAD